MKKYISAFICAGMIMSVLCTGCNSGTKPDTKPTTPESTTAAQTEAETTAETEEPTTEKEVIPPHEWEVGKLSGALEDFEGYFNLDVKPYQKAIDQAGEMNQISYPSEVVGADREAYVYTPYGYDESKEYPVIYLIHGIGCDGGQWVSMGAGKMFDNMIANGEIKPFIAVFPSVIPKDGLDKTTLSPANIGAFTQFIDEFKKDLAPYMAQNYAISTKREDTAVCGLSMGGMEALELGFSLLDTFNYIGSFSAAPTLNTSLLTLEGSEYTPALVLLCSGDKDGTVGTNPENYHKELSKNNVDHIWYYHPGQNHSPSVWNLGLLNFLKRTFQ